jgi:PPOX class probable F420-dependent enzyme
MPSDTELAAFLAEPFNVQVAGIRKDGRPHLSPNWFHWDGSKFYVSTTRNRAKYKIFRRDPRVELVIDDPANRRYVGLSGTVEILEDVPANVPYVRTIREKHGRVVPGDQELAAELTRDERILLAITPTATPDSWTYFGFR